MEGDAWSMSQIFKHHAACFLELGPGHKHEYVTEAGAQYISCLRFLEIVQGFFSWGPRHPSSTDDR